MSQLLLQLISFSSSVGSSSSEALCSLVFARPLNASSSSTAEQDNGTDVDFHHDSFFSVSYRKAKLNG